MEKMLFTLWLVLALAATRLPAVTPVLTVARDQVVRTGNSSPSKSQGGIDLSGAKPIIASGPST